MSVPKSERRQSEVEYVVIIQQLEEFFLEANMDENNRIPGLSEELVRLAMCSYNSATKYFEMCNGRVMGTTALKKKYCQVTYWTVRELAAQMNILMAFRMKQGKSTKGLQLKTKDILKVCDLLKNQLTNLNKATD